MSRRAGLSPLRTTVQKIIDRGETDPRDTIIRKLKDDLIMVRGAERQLAILQNTLRQIEEKARLLQSQKVIVQISKVKTQQEGKLKLQLSVRTISQLRKQIEMLKGQLKNAHLQLSQIQQEEGEYRKALNAKNVQIQKLKKESFVLADDNQKLMNQYFKLKSQEQESIYQSKKISQRIRDYQTRNSQIGRKIMEVKDYINELHTENQTLREKLKKYQNQNMGINDDLQKKQSKLDNLEMDFAQKHQKIKQIVQNYIEMEHRNQKTLKQIKHKINLQKMQNQKFNELSAQINKTQRKVNDQQKQIDLISQEIGEIIKVNRQFQNDNQKLKRDLANCQSHLENLLKTNSGLQTDLDSMIRQDQTAVSVLRRKKVLPSLQNFQSIRNSRNQFRSSRGYV